MSRQDDIETVANLLLAALDGEGTVSMWHTDVSSYGLGRHNVGVYELRADLKAGFAKYFARGQEARCHSTWLGYRCELSDGHQENHLATTGSGSKWQWPADAPRSGEVRCHCSKCQAL